MTGVESTKGEFADWSGLITNRHSIPADQSVALAFESLTHKQAEYAAVLSNDRPVGLCSKGMIGSLMASQFGHSVYSKKRIVDHMLPTFSCLKIDVSWQDGLNKLLSRQGSEFHHDAVLVDAGGRYLGLISVQAIIHMQSRLLLQKTQRLESQQALLRETEEKYRSIVENAIEGIFQTSPEGRIISANMALARIFGYESPDEIKHAVTDIAMQIYVDPNRRAEFVRTIEHQNSVSDFEAQAWCKDRHVIWILVSARVVRDSQGRIIIFEGIVEDITERKRVDDELRNANRRLKDVLDQLQRSQKHIIQQERLSALGQMAAGIAHDFNNALAPILGYSELLVLRPELRDDSARMLRYLKTINSAASDAARVVSRLRDFYRPRESFEALDAVDLNALLSQVISLTQPKWKDQAQMNGVNIRVRCDFGTIPPVQGNDAELREMLINLVFNAVDAMPHGGEIVLRTYSQNGVRLEVKDTGIGMNEDVRRRCMEPFFTTKGERGTGLGLSMVFGIVSRHSGTIEIESTPGSGTVFFIQLPAHVSASKKINVPQTSISIAPYKILLVDDEPLVLDVIQEYLLADASSVSTASGGAMALEKFKTGVFDLVITDRSMPGINGDRVAAEIKAMSPYTPVIMLTGFGEFMNARGEQPDGVDLVLSKPLKMEELREAMRKIGPRAASARQQQCTA